MLRYFSLYSCNFLSAINSQLVQQPTLGTGVLNGIHFVQGIFCVGISYCNNVKYFNDKNAYGNSYNVSVRSCHQFFNIFRI